MNPKQEFIKAIMQVLRLEANIYTMGAIEEIIDRLETPDYTLFIAYLGERESNYEKPIESIAKGVNEYYDLKIEPIKQASKKKANFISQAASVFTQAGKNIEDIVGVKFITEQGELEYSKDDFELLLSCSKYDKFRDGGYGIWYEIQDEVYNKLMDGIVKPTIENKIEKKSFDIAQKTLGICLDVIQKQITRYV